MSDKMTPIPFNKLMLHILAEQKQGSVFSVKRAFVPTEGKLLPLFAEKMETPIGPAAGPHTQLCQNIISAYYAGCRFFELKTVQIMDGDELSRCVPKPCIIAQDEAYNCEWSTELYVPQAYDEYVKAWFALKLLTRAFGWGDPDGFIFNMSVGYDLAGIKSPKIDGFIEGLKDASSAPIWTECRRFALGNLDKLPNVDPEYVNSICPHVCTGITLSTLHGCPPDEIERIASYLITEKKLNTFIKCNPTILGYDFARKTLDDLGFVHIMFDDHHFREDLQYDDAIPMFRRLIALASENGVGFGLKLSNTFPVDVTRNELPSGEMYMSGRSLYPLTIEMAHRISTEFDGKLRLSFSGGIDAFNAAPLFAAGVWPITLATTLLKPGGYQRATQIANSVYALPYAPFSGVSVGRLDKLAENARASARNRRSVKPLPKRKLDDRLMMFDCFTAPCSHGCPIAQDIPGYVALVGEGRYTDALRLILEKNPLPFITGTICPHHCQSKCTRSFYEESVRIRRTKLTAAQNGLESVLEGAKPVALSSDKRVAIVGGGPAGMALCFFLTHQGVDCTIFEKESALGGIVRHVIPEFRISSDAIDNDEKLLKALGAKIVLNHTVSDANALFEAGFTHVVFAVGAQKHGALRLEKGESMNVIDFLGMSKANTLPALGENVAVVGGGNTAMDAARAAKRADGVKNVRIIYRRDAANMPADEEELQLCQSSGVEFCELLSPVALENGLVTCSVMRLGEPDASGRRSPVDTGEHKKLPCDTLIAAVGEKTDLTFFAASGAENDGRRLKLNENLMTTRKGLYACGDCSDGPATVVEAIADARRVADAIAGEYKTTPAHKGNPSDCYAKQGILQDYSCAERETERCLDCAAVCECCVQVCPNRANVELAVNGGRVILHIDSMCNECGNCEVFCPYTGKPYKDKLTLYASTEELKAGENKGFAYLGGSRFASNFIDDRLPDIYSAILQSYSYLL